MLKTERVAFAINFLFTLAGYVGITLWLNSIRTTAVIWFVWVLIIVQLILYFWFFSTSHLRLKSCGYKYSWIFVFILCLLGRVNDWEIIILPLLTVVTLIISGRKSK